jgi:uncharacterized membrane protein
MANELDVSARAGLLLGAAAIGASYQRSLLSRSTVDQAVISGASASAWYGWGAAAHGVLRAVAVRLPGAGDSPGRQRAVGVAVDAAVLLAGAATVRSIPAREHERTGRALVRLAAAGTAAAAAAGLGSLALGGGRGRRQVLKDLSGVAAVGGVSYALTRPRTQVTGADTPDATAGQDTVLEVSPAAAAAVGAATVVALTGLAHGESRLSTAIAWASARVLGGDPSDHRTLGRLGAAAITAGVAWRGLSAVVLKLQNAGEGSEAPHAQAPVQPEVTGSPDSHIDWALQSREGRRWLSMTPHPDHIATIMGEPAKQPIRIYASLAAATTAEERAELLLREIDRTRALERSVFALFSPTGSGYVNYVADETLEYLTRGDCASAALEYSVLPSALSLTRVGLGTHQTRIVINGIVQRLLAMPADKRPRFVLFGESLGSQVSEEMFRGTGISGPVGAGLDAAIWIGTPQATRWRDEIWGTRTVADPPGLGPGAALVTRCMTDWTTLSAEERAQVRYLLLQNGDDPIPKFGPPVLWGRPDWLGPDERRPPGAPRGTRWLPVITFMATLFDMANALTPTPGVFVEGGHDYRLEVPEAVRSVWSLSCTDDQMARVQAALREREVGWEADRRWSEAQAKPEAERSAEEAKVEAQVASWTARDKPLTAEEVEELIAEDIQPS